MILKFKTIIIINTCIEKDCLCKQINSLQSSIHTPDCLSSYQSSIRSRQGTKVPIIALKTLVKCKILRTSSGIAKTIDLTVGIIITLNK